MPRWSDFLERFRAAAAPGAAAPRGVPADRARGAAEELQPLLMLLDPVEDEAARIRRIAQAHAAQLRRDGDRQSEQAVANARASMESVAEQAMSSALAETFEEVGDADRVVRQLEANVAQRLPEYVDRAVRTAHTIVAELGGPDTKATPR
ncbi:hypothetical protein [Nocardia africana]